MLVDVVMSGRFASTGIVQIQQIWRRGWGGVGMVREEMLTLRLWPE